ncbi:MAG: glycoside hydrolase family 97 N-terminal domain-containing protein, partial [Bacteroidota bacterium]|nr:glycoside hydrolase family 97 N-terminal domain-containing protein [Bacteroidota bacterium]
MKTTLFLLLFIFAGLSIRNLAAQETKSLQSPDGKLSITFQLTEEGSMSYSFNAFKRNVISESPLGFTGGNSISVPSSGWYLEKSEQHSIVSVWKP